jgi:hypothetical protein
MNQLDYLISCLSGVSYFRFPQELGRANRQ